MSQTPLSLSDSIIAAMEDKILAAHLDLLKTYPKDLYVHDRAALDSIAVAGMSIAWAVGNTHTHLVPLGIHPDINDEPRWLTNLSNADRFYIIRIRPGSTFTFDEVSRDGFDGLSNLAIPYSMEGSEAGRPKNSVGSFWLLRNKVRVGHVRYVSTGTTIDPSFDIHFTPVSGITPLDRVALERWGWKQLTKYAGTLFVKQRDIWNAPASQNLAA